MKSLLLFVIAGWVALSCAQDSSLPPNQSGNVQRLVKFSGTLARSQRGGIVGPVPVLFNVYNRPFGGAAYWQETQTVQPDAQGRYTVLLGGNTPGGVPPGIFDIDQGTNWLEVRLAGKTQGPRVELLELPSTPQPDPSPSGTLSPTERKLGLILVIVFLVGTALLCREVIKWWKRRMEQYLPPPLANLINYVRDPGGHWRATQILWFPLSSPDVVCEPSQNLTQMQRLVQRLAIFQRVLRSRSH